MRITGLVVSASLLLPVSALAAGKAKKPPAAAVSKGGAHTKADLEAAKALVKPFAPWADMKKVTEKIGAAQKTEGDKNFWFVKDGDACVQLEIDKMGDSVGMTSIASYDKAMKDNYAKCDGVK